MVDCIRYVNDYGNDIQRAIDSLPLTGGKIMITSGSYVSASSITITGSDIEICGAGPSTYIKNTSGSSCFNIGASGSPVHNVKIKNIKFEGTNDTADAYNFGVYLLEGKNCEINSCFFEKFGRYGMFFATSIKSICTNNIFLGTKDQGVIFDNGANHNVCSNNIFVDCNGGVVTDINSNYNTISGNSFFGTNTDTSFYGSKTGFGEGQNCNYNTYIGNTIFQCKGHGIFINGSNCVVNGNTIYGVGYNGVTDKHGIFLQGRKHVVSGNTIEMGNGQHGIMVQADNTIISDNMIIGSGNLGSGIGNGILLFRGNNCIIKGNEVGSFLNNHGINIYHDTGSSQNCIISDNYIYSGGSYGIFLFHVGSSIISGNILENNTSGGINGAITNGSIINNIIY